MLCADVAITTQRDVVAIESYDAVKYEVSWLYLCEDGETDAQLMDGCEVCLIAHVNDEGTHAVALEGEGDGMPLVDESYHLGEEYGIGDGASMMALGYRHRVKPEAFLYYLFEQSRIVGLEGSWFLGEAMS